MKHIYEKHIDEINKFLDQDVCSDSELHILLYYAFLENQFEIKTKSYEIICDSNLFRTMFYDRDNNWCLRYSSTGINLSKDMDKQKVWDELKEFVKKRINDDTI